MLNIRVSVVGRAMGTGTSMSSTQGVSSTHEFSNLE